MIRKLLGDSFVYTLSTFLSKGIGIIMIPIYTRLLSPRDFGIVDLLTVFGTVVGVVVNLEVHQAVARFYPDAPSAVDKKRIVSTALWFVLAMYAVFNVAALPLRSVLAFGVLNDAGHSRLFMLAVWAMTANFLFYFLQSQLVWQLRSRQNAAAAILYTLLTATLTVLLLVGARLGVAAVFIAQIVAAGAAMLVSFWCARESYGFLFDSAVLKTLLRFSLPLVPSVLAVYGMLYLDRYIISRFLTLGDVGLYSVAYKLASAAGLLAVGVQTALTPLIYTHYKEPETPGRIALLFRYFFLVAMVAIMTISVFARDIMRLLTQPDYYGAASLAPFLLMSVLFSSILNFCPGIFVRKRTVLIVYINIAGLLASVLMNVVAVKLFGVIGAAVATMLSSMLYFGLYLFFGNRLYPVPYPWLPLASAFACCWAATGLVHFGALRGFGVKLVLAVVAAAAMTLLLARRQEWKQSYALLIGGRR